MKTLTINAVSADGQQHIVTVRESEVAKRIKIMKNKGLLNIKVTNK
jgi:hypothetical protein